MIKILCDSMSDIPLDIIKKYNIGIIPLTVIFNNKEYLDGDNLIKDEFYKMLRRTDMMPKTSQATYHQFETEFKKYDKSTEVLYIAGSSFCIWNLSECKASLKMTVIIMCIY